jgi:two-component system chemotaxis sensor kinase CheA
MAVDLTRFVELYVSESCEHLSLLSRGLLALERGDPAGLDEAFRAAHTIKGLSATMGYARVTDLAHALEDRLERFRCTGGRADGAGIDALLVLVDELDAAVTDSASTAPAGASDVDSTFPERSLESASRRLIAPNTMRVRLRRDAPIKAARAVLIRRAAEGAGGVTGSIPATFDEQFDGEFLLLLTPDADRSALEKVVRAGGDVDSIAFEEPGVTPSPAPKIAPPVTHVRVDQRRLDELAECVSELSVLHTRLTKSESVDVATADLLGRASALLGSLQRSVLEMRMVPVGTVFDRFPRMVRDAARSLGKEITFVVEGADIELDRSILDEIVDPLVHLLRNAVDHGIELPEDRVGAGKSSRGELVLRAVRERTSVLIQVSDDGRGVSGERVVARARSLGLLPADAPSTLPDDELFRLMSRPGFSTADSVTSVSGRGVGLDAVVERIRTLGGAIEMTSARRSGTTFSLRLPITLALAQALRVRVGDEDYAIPLTHLTEVIDLDGVMIVASAGREAVRVREDLLPLVRLAATLRVPVTGRETAAVVAELGERRAALAVDALVGREQIVVKGFDAATGTLPMFSGATLLSDGRPALVLDPVSML